MSDGCSSRPAGCDSEDVPISFLNYIRALEKQNARVVRLLKKSEKLNKQMEKRLEKSQLRWQVAEEIARKRFKTGAESDWVGQRVIVYNSEKSKKAQEEAGDLDKHKFDWGIVVAESREPESQLTMALCDEDGRVLLIDGQGEEDRERGYPDLADLTLEEAEVGRDNWRFETDQIDALPAAGAGVAVNPNWAASRYDSGEAALKSWTCVRCGLYCEQTDDVRGCVPCSLAICSGCNGDGRRRSVTLRQKVDGEEVAWKIADVWTWLHAVLYLVRCVLGTIDITNASTSILQPPPSDAAEIIDASRSRKVQWCSQLRQHMAGVCPHTMTKELMEIKDSDDEPVVTINEKKLNMYLSDLLGPERFRHVLGVEGDVDEWVNSLVIRALYSYFASVKTCTCQFSFFNRVELGHHSCAAGDSSGEEDRDLEGSSQSSHSDSAKDKKSGDPSDIDSEDDSSGEEDDKDRDFVVDGDVDSPKRTKKHDREEVQPSTNIYPDFENEVFLRNGKQIVYKAPRISKRKRLHMKERAFQSHHDSEGECGD